MVSEVLHLIQEDLKQSVYFTFYHLSHPLLCCLTFVRLCTYSLLSNKIDLSNFFYFCVFHTFILKCGL